MFLFWKPWLIWPTDNTVGFFFEFFISLFTSSGLKLCIKSIHRKQYVVPIYFSVVIGFMLDCAFFMYYNVGSIFLTIHFKHLDFIEWFNLNSNSNNLFERSSISDFLVCFLVCFLVDLIMYVYIWFISLLMSKFGSSRSILIILIPLLSMINCLPC